MSILLRFLGESVGAEKAAASTALSIKEVEKTSTLAGRELAGLARTTQGQLVPGLGAGTGALGKMSGALTGGAGVAAGAVVAGAAIADLAIHGVKDYLDLTDTVRSLQRVTGATAEDSSKLNAVLHRTGVDANAGAGALFQLSKNIEHHADKLHADGIEIVKNDKGQVDLTATLANVAGAYQAAGKGVEGNNIAADAFGKTGKVLLPILGKTKDEINGIVDAANKHHEIVSQDDLDKSLDLKVKMKDLNDAFHGVEMELGKGLIPALATGAGWLETWIEKGDDLFSTLRDFVSEPVVKVGKAAEKTAGQVAGLDDNTKSLTRALAANKAELEKVNSKTIDSGSSISEMSAAVKSAKDDLDAATKSEAEYAKAVYEAQLALNEASKAATADDLAKAALSVEQAYRSLGASETDITTATKKLADARAHGGEVEIAAGAVKVTDAHRAVIRSNEDLAASERKVHDARAALAKLNAGPTADQLSKAQDKVTASMRSEQQAARGVVDALNAVASANHRVEDSEQGFRDASFDVESAQIKVQRATEALTAARAAGDPAAETAAQDDLRQALHDQQDAQDGERKATEAMVDAKTGVASAEHGVADARQHVADAERDINDALREQAALRVIDPKAAADAQQAVLDALRDQRTAQASVNQSIHDESDARKELDRLRLHAHDDAVKQAEQDLQKATDDQTSSTLALHDAQRQQLAVQQQGTAADPAMIRATQDKADAIRDLGKAHDVLSYDAAAAAGNVQLLHDKLVSLANSSPQLRSQIDEILRSIGAPVTTNGQVNDPKPGEHLANVTHRAKGGPLAKGQPSFVGEDGEELWVPDEAGTIVPNGALGGEVHYHTHTHHNTVQVDLSLPNYVGDSQQFRREVQSSLVEWVRSNGPDVFGITSSSG